MRLNRTVLSSSVVLAALLCGSGTSLSNPISVDGAHAVQVPDTFHVQVTAYCMPDFGCAAPSAVRRDGEPVQAPWLGPTTIDVNGGSGVSGYEANQVCDCDVAPGTHEYELVFEAGQEPFWGSKLTVVVTDPPPGPPEPPEPPDPDADVFPWDEPEPPWPKGVDCAQWCQDDPPVGEDAGAPVHPDSGTHPPVDAGGSQDVAAPVDTVTPNVDSAISDSGAPLGQDAGEGAGDSGALPGGQDTGLADVVGATDTGAGSAVASTGGSSGGCAATPGGAPVTLMAVLLLLGACLVRRREQ